MNDTLGVALTYLACPCCGEPKDSRIVMNTRPTKGYADKVKNLDKQVVGFMDEPCSDCKELMKKGVVLITIDPDKTDDWKNPYRTGGFFVITEEAATRIFTEDAVKPLLKKRMGWLDHNDAIQLGLFEQATK